LPALVYATDWLLYIGMLMIPAVAPLAIYGAMPFFRRIDATSAYEYLGKRFNLPVRILGSGLFTLFHISRMGIVMALTALALSAVTPLTPWQSVLIMGVLCLIYCTMGGVEAVIWTDTIQTVVLLGGAVVCVFYILAGVDGGLGGVLDLANANGKMTLVNLDFSPDSFTTLALWVIILGGIGQNLSSYTSDQAVVQRYMTTKTIGDAARSIWANGIMAVFGSLLFFFIGTGLYAFYHFNPAQLNPTIQNDQVFPMFIATELPVGIAGLIVAGIFAAAQSTVSTSMNSTATTLVTDFLRPFNRCDSEAGYLKAAKVLTFMMGVLGTLAGLVFISPEIRSLMSEYFKVIGMFMGALGGLFLLGILTTRAHARGAFIGLLGGVAVMIWVWRATETSGYIYAFIGISSCLLIGYAASVLLPAEKHDLENLTLHTLTQTKNAND
jgi:solute:Na+ symporter, SSS family